MKIFVTSAPTPTCNIPSPSLFFARETSSSFPPLSEFPQLQNKPSTVHLTHCLPSEAVKVSESLQIATLSVIISLHAYLFVCCFMPSQLNRVVQQNQRALHVKHDKACMLAPFRVQMILEWHLCTSGACTGTPPTPMSSSTFAPCFLVSAAAYVMDFSLLPQGTLQQCEHRFAYMCKTQVASKLRNHHHTSARGLQLPCRLYIYIYIHRALPRQ